MHGLSCFAARMCGRSAISQWLRGLFPGCAWPRSDLPRGPAKADTTVPISTRAEEISSYSIYHTRDGSRICVTYFRIFKRERESIGQRKDEAAPREHGCYCLSPAPLRRSLDDYTPSSPRSLAIPGRFSCTVLFFAVASHKSTV